MALALLVGTNYDELGDGAGSMRCFWVTRDVAGRRVDAIFGEFS